MTDQLPDFGEPGSQPAEQPSPRKPRPRPQRKRPAKKVAKRKRPRQSNGLRAAPLPSASRSAGAHQKRAPKKRRVRKNAPPTFRLPPQPSMRRNGFEENETYMSKKEFSLVMQVNTMLAAVSRESRIKILDWAKGF